MRSKLQARRLLKKTQSPRRPQVAAHLPHRIQPRLPRITAQPRLPSEETVAEMEGSAEAPVAAMDSKVAQEAQAREAGVARSNKWA